MKVRGIVLACGNSQSPLITDGDRFEVRQVAERPGKAEVDAVLADSGDKRLVVHGTDGDLNAVVLRLLRTERLADVPLGYVPADPRSEVAALWGLPTDPGRALDLALSGDPDRVPLVRDDVGGVLVGLGSLGPVRGVGYGDDTVVLRGQASRLEVTPDPEGGPGLVVRVIHKRLFGRKVTSTQARAFQLGCLPVQVDSDGVPHPRPMGKWTWYRHTEDLRLVRGM
ncbi:diacylglycerol kinase family protein [Saccharothrix texasensis]|uniref:diacylglycerol kinase family protein n=1 Tax=Saccharothrix texasensis TaxID=103734 RepID=UPI000F4BBF46